MVTFALLGRLAQRHSGGLQLLADVSPGLDQFPDGGAGAGHPDRRLQHHHLEGRGEQLFPSYN